MVRMDRRRRDKLINGLILLIWLANSLLLLILLSLDGRSVFIKLLDLWIGGSHGR